MFAWTSSLLFNIVSILQTMWVLNKVMLLWEKGSNSDQLLDDTLTKSTNEKWRDTC